VKIREIETLLDSDILCGRDKMDMEIECACGSDMMSEVLAFTKHAAALLTGLANIHVIKTAEILDIGCVIFVRGKTPAEEIIKMAQDRGMVLMSTDLPMFTACGILYSNGIAGGMRGE